MNAAQRRMIIFQKLEEQGAVEVSALSSELGVSTMTIRRDLSLFEKQGLVKTNYGGAYLLESAGAEPSFALKQGSMSAAKAAIGAEAARIASGCSSVVLDCGTTALEAARYLSGRAMTIITSSWPVVVVVEMTNFRSGCSACHSRIIDSATTASPTLTA